MSNNCRRGKYQRRVLFERSEFTRLNAEPLQIISERSVWLVLRHFCHQKCPRPEDKIFLRIKDETVKAMSPYVVGNYNLPQEKCSGNQTKTEQGFPVRFLINITNLHLIFYWIARSWPKVIWFNTSIAFLS